MNPKSPLSGFDEMAVVPQGKVAGNKPQTPKPAVLALNTRSDKV
jgi:hypothetical protein